jgi:starch phosphorylase
MLERARRRDVSRRRPQSLPGIVDALRHHDYFMVTADFAAYQAAQRAAGALWRDPAGWWRKSILNTARMSWFSADRAILDYAREIWRTEPGLR